MDTGGGVPCILLAFAFGQRCFAITVGTCLVFAGLQIVTEAVGYHCFAGHSIADLHPTRLRQNIFVDGSAILISFTQVLGSRAERMQSNSTPAGESLC